MPFPVVPVLAVVASIAAILKRNTYNYELKRGGKTVYRGITNDPDRRMQEHLRSGKQFDSMSVGEATWRSVARKKEARSLESYRRSHGGSNPKYNKKRNG